MKNKEPDFLTLEYSLEHLDEFPECRKFCTLPGEIIFDDFSIINSLSLLLYFSSSSANFFHKSSGLVET